MSFDGPRLLNLIGSIKRHEVSKVHQRTSGLYWSDHNLTYLNPKGGVHKLRLQDLSFFYHLPPSVYIFYGIKVDKKLIFFRPPTPSYCKRSLWTPPYVIYELSVRILIKMLAEFGGHQLKRASFSIFSTFLTRKKQMPSEFFKSTNRFLKVN